MDMVPCHGQVECEVQDLEGKSSGKTSHSNARKSIRWGGDEGKLETYLNMVEWLSSVNRDHTGLALQQTPIKMVLALIHTFCFST